MKSIRLHVGSVQSKAISLFVFASLILTPLTARATDYPPSVPNSNVFTTSTEVPKVDGPTGAFTQRIPLDIPPGRNGLQPDVTLDYNSQRTQDGIVGYGWSLSIPYIERLNKTGSQDLYGNSSFFTSSIEGELASEATTTPPNPSPTILDTLPVTRHDMGNGSQYIPVISGFFSYTVPAGGTNKLLACFIQDAYNAVSSVSQNGTSMTVAPVPGSTAIQAYTHFAYLANPTSGTLSVTFSTPDYASVWCVTLQDAAQTNPIDAQWRGGSTPVSSFTTSTTTSIGNDILLTQCWRSWVGHFLLVILWGWRERHTAWAIQRAMGQCKLVEGSSILPGK